MKTLQKLVVACASLAVVAVIAPAQAAPLPTYTVITYANDYSVSYGDTVKIYGTVSGPGAVGSAVKYYVKYDYSSSFRYIGTSKIAKNGRYAKNIKSTQGGITAYKVVKPALSGKVHGSYDSAYVDVYRWFLLASLSRAGGDYPAGNPKTADVKIKKTLFKDSLVFKDQQGADYFLHGFCTKIMTSVGVNDYVPAGTTGTIKGSGYIQYLGYTEKKKGDKAQPITEYLDGAPDTLQVTGYMEGGKGSWVMGRPQIKCNVSSVSGIEESFD